MDILGVEIIVKDWDWLPKDGLILVTDDQAILAESENKE